MKKILVAIGGFDYSQKVLSEAKQMARCLAAEVTIMNVIDLSREERAYSKMSFYEDIKEGALKSSQELLNSAKEAFADFGGNVDTVSKIGNSADEIINYAEIGGYDMIIMGSRSTGIFNRGQLGSVADKVVRYVKVPVYIIK
jgi:nucleotide-binding universal stress UspA family protein